MATAKKVTSNKATKATTNRATTKKREAVIVRAGVAKVEINNSEQLGLKWNKPSAVLSGSRKVKSASGGSEEQSAAGQRTVTKGARATRAAAPAAQTVGFGRGAGTGRRKAGKVRIATGISGPTSRAEPRVGGSGEQARKRQQSPR